MDLKTSRAAADEQASARNADLKAEDNRRWIVVADLARGGYTTRLIDPTTTCPSDRIDTDPHVLSPSDAQRAGGQRMDAASPAFSPPETQRARRRFAALKVAWSAFGGLLKTLGFVLFMVAAFGFVNGQDLAIVGMGLAASLIWIGDRISPT